MNAAFTLRPLFHCAALLASNLVCLHLSQPCAAQDNRNQFNQLLLPTSRAAQTTLQRPCQLWAAQQLRPRVIEIENQFQIPIWLDRRIDSGQTVELSRSADSSTLGTELEKLAVSCGAAGGLVENIYIIAPANRLAQIQRAAVVLHGQLTTVDKSFATDSRSIAWEDITTSNELLELIRKTWDIELVGGELPHDLLHNGKLPRCSLASQLTLLLAGFDLQATLENSKARKDSSATKTPIKLTIQTLGTGTAWADSYARTPSATQLEELKKKYSSSTFEVTKNSCKVEGLTNAHIELLSLGLQPKRPKPTQDKDSLVRYSFAFKVGIPVEAVVNELAKGLQFEPIWSEECTSKHRSRQIQLSLDKATRQELLEAVGKAADLTLIDQKTKVLISPK